MNPPNKKDDLREYRFFRLTILQWMAVLAIIGIAGYLVFR